MFAIVKRIMQGRYSVSFCYKTEKNVLGNATIEAQRFNELIELVKNELEVFFGEVLEA